ncbi:amidohydrolase family protein [Ochrobactrum pecoris]|nr:amidohydrolase family protein [Brucella pecoris]
MIIDAHNHLGVRAGAVQTGADLIARIDAVGVDKAVMFPFVEGNFTNEPIKEAFDQFPDRLIPFCAVNAWEAGAADEVRRCVVDWGFKGLKLHPTINGYHLSDPHLVDPLFKVADELGIPVIVHGASDLYNSPPEFALMAARFPNVPLLMAHMGFFGPWIRLSASHENSRTSIWKHHAHRYSRFRPPFVRSVRIR